MTKDMLLAILLGQDIVCMYLNVVFECFFFFFFQAEDGIRDLTVTGVQTCALPILLSIRKKQLAKFRSLFCLLQQKIFPEALSSPVHFWLSPAIQGHGSLPIDAPAKIGRASCRERV